MTSIVAIRREEARKGMDDIKKIVGVFDVRRHGLNSGLKVGINIYRNVQWRVVE